MSQEIEKKIKEVLDEVRPHLQMDGGDVEFVSFNVDSGELQVRLQGACHGCAMSQMTLQNGIGAVVKERVPEVKDVVSG